MTITPLSGPFGRAQRRIWSVLASPALLVVTSGCGNLFQSMVSKYGPTTDQQGSDAMQEAADCGRELLAKEQFAEAIAESCKIWKGFQGSDSRKGGIATVYLRNFCDALYEAEKTYPAFQIAALFQLAAESFPKDVASNKAGFIEGDRQKLSQRSRDAAAKAKPEPLELAAAATKRGHLGTAMLYQAQLLRMYGEDAGTQSAGAAAMVALRAKYLATVTFKGTAELAPLVTTAGNRPSKHTASAGNLSAEASLGAATYKRSREAITLTANVLRGKKEAPNPKHAFHAGRIHDAERNIASHKHRYSAEMGRSQGPRKGILDSERQGIERNERQRDTHQKSLSKEPATVLVDNVVAASYPAVRETVVASLALTGKVPADHDVAGEALQKTATVSVDAVSHDGFAEARLPAERVALPADAAMHGRLVAAAAGDVAMALTRAFDNRLLKSFKSSLAGAKADQVEAETAPLLLTALANPVERAARITTLTRLPDVAGLAKMLATATAAK